VWFVLFGPVAWTAVGLVAIGSAAGGLAGATLARRLPPDALRVAVALFAIAIGIRMLV
jgi:uncharacterized membrane protein YfcA